MEPSTFKIFVVEDDEWYRKLLEYNLNLNPDYEVKTFASGKECLAALSEAPDLITLDYRLPDMTGDQIMKEIHAKNEDIRVIIISEQKDIEVVVSLLKEGAYDYILKSDEIRDRLLNSVNHILKTRKLESRIKVLEKEVAAKYDFQKSIIGRSPVMEKVFELLQKACNTSITVMVTGETGTGKEVVAKALHYSSKRKKGPFVAVNVGAIPTELIESELFGHEKGAFTGANNRRIGKFEEANGGTLFLDEIAEMDLNLQVKLLRVLQEREVVRVGSNQPIALDCRIIAATHRDLKQEIKEGRFREDLYYRLFGLPIELPPLRERGEDILLLARKFMQDFAKENELNSPSLSEGARQKLLAYPFPGNVRELKSLVELAVVCASGDEIGPEDLRFSENEVLPEVIAEQLTLREYNHRILNIFLERHDQDVKKVAEILDIGVATIYRMKKEMEEE